MKIIHCADLHLDSKMETNLSSGQAKERRMELLLTFEHMISYARSHGVEAVIIAGDLFDTASVSGRTIMRIQQIMQETPEIIYYVVRGNHDVMDIADLFETLPDNLKLFGNTWSYYRQGCCVIAGLDLNEKNAGSQLTSLQLEEEICNLVVLHGQLEDVQQTGRNDAARIPLRALAGQSIDYLALGHVHGYQKGALDARGVWCYSGCLEGRGFDECGEKGFVLLEVSGQGVQSQFVPIADRVFYEVIVDLDAENCTIEHTLDEVLQSIEPQHFVKLVLRGSLPMDLELDIAYWQKKYEADHYVLRIADETKRQLDASEYEHDATLKGEFVRHVQQSTLTQEQRKAVMQMGLKALAGEVI